VENRLADVVLRAVLLLVAFVALFYPDDNVSAAAAGFVLIATILGVLRHRLIAPPKGVLQSEPAL
jgi:hypothetical protein